MDFFNSFMPFAAPTAAIGIVAFIIIAIIQEAKTSGRVEAVRSAFIYVTSLMTLLITIGSVLFLLQQAVRLSLPSANRPNSTYVEPPPTLYLTYGGKEPQPVSCTDTCLLSTADKEQYGIWKEQYQAWRANKPAASARYTLEDKRQTVNAISFLVVALPLFWWFFF